jgi:hypothetical protein
VLCVWFLPDKLHIVPRHGFADQHSANWIQVVLLMIPGLTQETLQTILPDIIAYHTEISTRMATHLQITAQNLKSSYWLAGAMLSTDPVVARTAAREYYEHLVRSRRAALTPFDAAFSNDLVKMEQLHKFANKEPPTLLWKDSCAYSKLFRYLGNRFLSAPDSVLDVEGIHAVWQWISALRRNLSFKCLNSILKIGFYLQNNGETSLPIFR